MRRRGLLAAWTSAAATAVVLIATSAFGLHRPVPQPQAQSPSVTPVAQPPSPRVFIAEESDRVVPGGPLVDSGMAMALCAKGYSPTALVESSFAFDGTVTGIGPGRTDRRPATGISALRAVTFHVNTWFKGGSDDTALVDMPQPNMTGKRFNQRPRSYQIGTRLLVTGTPSSGGAPPDNAIARRCGFTRYYSPERAAEWAAATKMTRRFGHKDAKAVFRH